MLHNIKIGKRLILTFILIVILSSISGIVGLIRMSDMNAKYSQALKDYGFAQGNIGRFNTEFNNGRAIIGNIINADDSDKISKYVAQLTVSNSKVDSFFKAMDKDMVTEKEKSCYNNIKKNLSKFTMVRSQAITLATQKENKYAQTLSSEKLTPLSDSIRSSTDALYNQKSSMGTQLAEQLARQGVMTDITIFVIIIVSVFISLLIASKISLGISRPVKEIEEAAQKMSEGNLNIQVYNKSNDEIGQMAKAFSKSANSIKTYITDLEKNLGLIAEGNLNITTELNYIGDYKSLKLSYMGIAASLNGMLTQINQVAAQVASSSGQVSTGSQAFAQGAAEQASSAERLVSLSKQISDHVKQNDSFAAQASKTMQNVCSDIELSKKCMDDMMNAMSKIHDSSKQIGQIIKTVENIAFQTNILAINAAVEAARAGKAGKGFSVVADEVRNLAGKSSKSSKDITVLIEDTINQVENGTKIADETAKSLFNVIQNVQAVAKTVDHISQATNRQSSEIDQISGSINQISNIIQTNSATAEESAAASEELTAQAQNMKSLIGKFVLSKSSEPLDEEQ